MRAIGEDIPIDTSKSSRILGKLVFRAFLLMDAYQQAPAELDLHPTDGRQTIRTLFRSEVSL